MKTRIIGSILVTMLGLSCAQSAAAAGEKTTVPRCAPNQQRANDNNNLLLLGGIAQGPIKQVIVGEFGKDVDRQKRLLGKFDRCGVLTRADISYDKQEGGTRLTLEMSVEPVSDGWQAQYEVTVLAQRDGEERLVHHKLGTTHYFRGRDGSIVSASERFLLQDEAGFTVTTNGFDRRGRLVSSVSRSSDSSSSDDYRYRWDEKNRLVDSTSLRSSIRWNYDKQGRELGVDVREDGPLIASTTVDQCQLWDDRGNCTLSYSREMEVSALGLFRRNSAAASRYEYWDRP